MAGKFGELLVMASKSGDIFSSAEWEVGIRANCMKLRG
jgi:hypothetical protein